MIRGILGGEILSSRIYNSFLDLVHRGSVRFKLCKELLLISNHFRLLLGSEGVGFNEVLTLLARLLGIPYHYPAVSVPPVLYCVPK